jgi:protoporphyrinogen oxidase
MQTKTLLETFRYPRLGPGMMWEAARDKVVAAGSHVLMGHAMKQLASDGQGGWRLSATRVDADGTVQGETLIRARHAISSAPMRELATRLHPLPATTLEANRLRYRDFLTVALKIRSEDLFPDNWIYIHDSKVKVGRIQNFRSWSPEMVPDESVACVGLEYFCFEGDDLWAASDEALIALATKEMAILGLVRPEQVIGGVVVRQEKAYPVYDDEYAANVAAMRAELEAAYPTLHLVGRNGMHRYNNQDHAMMTAMLTVENIIAERRVYDIWCVNEDAEYHEAGDEGEQQALPAGRAPLSEDQAAALASVRDVPERIPATAEAPVSGKPGRRAA